MMPLPFIFDLQTNRDFSTLFPVELTDSELRMAGSPFHMGVLHATNALKKVFNYKGGALELEYVNKSENDLYRDACCLILNKYYNKNITIKDNAIVKIEHQGFDRFFKLTYNHSFAEIQLQDPTVRLHDEEVDMLFHNFDNMALWKDKFPKNTFVYKGFSLITLTNITHTYYKGLLADSLIDPDLNNKNIIQEISNNIFRTNDLTFGVSGFERNGNTWGFEHFNKVDSLFKSNSKKLKYNSNYFGSSIGDNLFSRLQPMVIQPENELYQTEQNQQFLKHLKKKKLKSLMLVPIVMRDYNYIFVLEFGHKQANFFNYQHLQTVNSVTHLFRDSLNQHLNKFKYLIEAVIQQECTSIHPSVKWKFDAAAKEFIKKERLGIEANFEDIILEDVFSLYGQIDIKGSSRTRERVLEKDFLMHFRLVVKILKLIYNDEKDAYYKVLKKQIKKVIKHINADFDPDVEDKAIDFLKEKVHPVFFEALQKKPSLSSEIESYFNKLDSSGSIYYYRKNYDTTVNIINKKLATFLDVKQRKAQLIHPHIYERYKTDGVEHNLYIGEAITEQNTFNEEHLEKLRFWQLKTMCEMERFFYANKHEYPVSLEMASMILAYNKEMTIRFRSDEKQFDVDGSYNVRYEVIKSRIDKAMIKDTDERVTVPGKIAIMYSHGDLEETYLGFIEKLQKKNFLKDDVEILEIAKIKGISGLKAMRVSVIYDAKK